MLKQKTKFYIFSLLLINLFLSYAPGVFAQTTPLPSYVNSGAESSIKDYLCTPTEADINSKTVLRIGDGQEASRNKAQGDLYLCINRIYRFAIVVAGVFGVFFIVIAGYVYMSADGNEESIGKAKGILGSTIAAMVILMIGYVLLKALNPDLIRFQNIQPPSVVLQNAEVPGPTIIKVTEDKNGNPTQIQGGASKTAAELITNGCDFQTQTQENEVPNMTQALFNKVKNICFNSNRDSKIRPQISSVIGYGKHTDGSQHYKGCAVDFADGMKDGYFDIKTSTGRDSGRAVFAAAVAQGMRINPGTDRDQTFHIHADLGSSCGQ